MWGVSSLAAVAAVVSTASGAIVPLHLVRVSSPHGISSISAPGESNDDYPFNWGLASYLAGLTDTLPTAIVQQDSSTTTSSAALNPLPTATESSSKAVDASMATPSPKLASSSATLATSIRTSIPFPKAHTQSTRASAPSPSYVSFNVFIRSLNSN